MRLDRPHDQLVQQLEPLRRFRGSGVVFIPPPPPSPSFGNKASFNIPSDINTQEFLDLLRRCAPTSMGFCLDYDQVKLYVSEPVEPETWEAFSRNMREKKDDFKTLGFQVNPAAFQTPNPNAPSPLTRALSGVAAVLFAAFALTYCVMEQSRQNNFSPDRHPEQPPEKNLGEQSEMHSQSLLAFFNNNRESARG
jgi:hypothetical protein